MQHLKESQDCPQCGERFVEFRKDTCFNHLIEAYDESGCRNDRSQEECRAIGERLNKERVFARFEYAEGDTYEGEWKKLRRDGKGKMFDLHGNYYEGDWKNNSMEGFGKMVFESGDIYEGEW